ncbi:potassium channel family protein [Mangrovactinospora gilvigrisea]|nr:potassium channel family protein [Mangrovactinospora gilvigrisea]
MPRPAAGPGRQVLRRFTIALLVLVVTTLIVWLDADGYRDSDHPGRTLTFIDAAYYATVTLSTTGYGDITPSTQAARVVNILVITPLRVLFLIILVGTTLEVLTERTREQFRQKRWRAALRDHIVIVGYGTKGRSAAQTLHQQGCAAELIVVVDPNHKAVELANHDGFTGVAGDGTRSEVLARAEVQRARKVVVAPQRDETSVLATLTVRQLNPRAKIVAAVREEENAPLLRQSGADAVVTTAASAGRLLGMSMASPNVAAVLEDLLSYGAGLDVEERPVTRAETGASPRALEEPVLAVVRGHRMLAVGDPAAAALRADDRVIIVHDTGIGPPGTVSRETRPASRPDAD